MTDTLKPMSKEWHDRQRRHRHNGYQGHCRMAMMNMRAIIDSDTSTPAAKTLANDIYIKAKVLAELLRHRVD